MRVQHISVKSYLSKSNLPGCDFAINPYVGCPHACLYCYASFMQRFSKHINEPWGSFLDVKHAALSLPQAKLHGKSVFLSTVTDCYNPYEAKYCLTQKLLNELCRCDCDVFICTKSALILRDLALLKQLRRVRVALSINTLDESFRQDMDKASRIQERLAALQTLHAHGIYTILFMSPLFPRISHFQHIVAASQAFVREYWFENLNLRGSYQGQILHYIKRRFPALLNLYTAIYCQGKLDYWYALSQEIDDYGTRHGLCFRNLFHYGSPNVHKAKDRLSHKTSSLHTKQGSLIPLLRKEP